MDMYGYDPKMILNQQNDTLWQTNIAIENCRDFP